MRVEIVAIGTSLGGVDALSRLFSGLPGDYSIPIVVVIHRGMVEFDYLIDVLQKSTALQVMEASDKLDLSPGHIVVAAADYHLLVDRGHCALSVDDPVEFARPSIDVLFESVADQFGATAVGILLTGGGVDGIHGLGQIKSKGGLVFAQSPATARDPVLPQAAIDRGIVTESHSIDELAKQLCGVCWRASGRAED